MTTLVANRSKQSRLALAAIVLIVLILVFVFIDLGKELAWFPRTDEGSRSVLEAGLSRTLGRMIGYVFLQGIWSVACVLTMIAFARAWKGRSRWHLVTAAIVLCLLEPAAAWVVYYHTPTSYLLVRAAQKGDKTSAKWCLAMGVDINRPITYKLGFNPASAPGIPGETPLTAAVGRKQYDMVRFLVQRGANVNLPDGTKRTPYQIAKWALDEPMARLLADLGADPALPPTVPAVSQSMPDVKRYGVPARATPRPSVAETQDSTLP